MQILHREKQSTSIMAGAFSNAKQWRALALRGAPAGVGAIEVT